DHALLEYHLTPLPEYRLLLMPPGSHTMPDQRHLIVPAVTPELSGDELVECSGRHTWSAAVDRHPIDVTDHCVVMLLGGTRATEDRVTGLVTRVPIEVGYVVCPDDVTTPKHRLAFARVRHQICAGVQDPVCPIRATPKAAVDDPTVDVTLGVADMDGGE